ncbi:MAG TPA: hypothetical protein VE987_09890 [Polyangiaceae bacterium]|nr:hypothetical protein [Polyangiaceae bacterium]
MPSVSTTHRTRRRAAATEQPGEAWPARARHVIREQPLLAVGVAAVAGAALGGVVFRRLGRLVFMVAVGYVTNELWHREGGLDVDDVVERLAG